MDLSLKGRRALVCGSSQGIGLASAIELAALGASVTLLARSQSRLQEAVLKLPRDSDQQHEILVADFDDPGNVKQTIDSYVRQNTISVLVNNTGGPPPGKAIEADLSDYLKAFSSHLICNQVLAAACVNGMQQQRYGRIINIISTSVKMPIKGLGVSNTIRGAVANWAKTLSFELGPFGITVNNVLPGATTTARFESLAARTAERVNSSIEDVKKKMAAEIPTGRIASPEEVAAAVAFLATPAASYINGINLPVDGGRTGSL
jgi:3-oxoacyl-[acyl-carrier protein] reductase